MMKSIRQVPLLLAASSTLVAVLFFSRPAFALWELPPFSCTVVDVGWDGRLFIDCAGTPDRFIAFPNISCANFTIAHPMDDMKTFESLAVLALLSGKPLILTFDPVCQAAGPGNAAITSVTLPK